MDHLDWLKWTVADGTAELWKKSHGHSLTFTAKKHGVGEDWRQFFAGHAVKEQILQWLARFEPTNFLEETYKGKDFSLYLLGLDLADR